MEKLPKETKIKGRDYVLWDTQYSQSNAELTVEIMVQRVPRSDPEIIMLKQDGQESLFGVYVKKEMSE